MVENKVTTAKSCCWSITINNPTEDDITQWNVLPTLPWVKEVKGQIEKGENGTPHIQGMVRTLSVRFSQVKRALPRAHIEVARNEKALAAYVVKEETRVAAIPTVRVATQKEIQSTLMEQTLGEYLKSGGANTLDGFFSWMEKEEMTSRFTMKHWAESHIDAAVKHLIRQGYYGVEFTMMNPQIRAGFKKYFKEIIIREYHARHSPQDSPTTPPIGQEEVISSPTQDDAHEVTGQHEHGID